MKRLIWLLVVGLALYILYLMIALPTPSASGG